MVEFGAFLSILVSLVVSSFVLDSSEAFVNVDLLSMPLDPDDFDSTNSFHKKGLMEMLPKVPIIVHLPPDLVIFVFVDFVDEPVGSFNKSLAV